MLLGCIQSLGFLLRFFACTRGRLLVSLAWVSRSSLCYSPVRSVSSLANRTEYDCPSAPLNNTLLLSSCHGAKDSKGGGAADYL